jgi:hypothetical protein
MQSTECATERWDKVCKMNLELEGDAADWTPLNALHQVLQSRGHIDQ